MRILFLLIVFAGCILGCSIRPAQRVIYKDTNGDGKIDQEYHANSGADMNWEMKDENFDGRYEKRIYHGFATEVTIIDKPIPKGKSPNQAMDSTARTP